MASFVLYCSNCYSKFNHAMAVGSLSNDGDVSIQRISPSYEQRAYFQTRVSFAQGTVSCGFCGGAVLEKTANGVLASTRVGDKIAMVAIGGTF